MDGCLVSSKHLFESRFGVIQLKEPFVNGCLRFQACIKLEDLCVILSLDRLWPLAFECLKKEWYFSPILLQKGTNMQLKHLKFNSTQQVPWMFKSFLSSQLPNKSAPYCFGPGRCRWSLICCWSSDITGFDTWLILASLMKRWQPCQWLW